LDLSLRERNFILNHFTCHQILKKIKQRKLPDVEHQRHLVVAVVAPLVAVVVHQGRADRAEENRALQRKFRIRISTFEIDFQEF